MVITPSVYTYFAALFVGRRDDYALQAPNGLYRRVGRPLTLDVLRAHLDGKQTIGTYVLNDRQACSYAVMDADKPGGLALLAHTQRTLAADGITSYLEQSRREGHLWIFFQKPAPAATVRGWLRPYCPDGMEFFPKQDYTDGYGSLVRLPLGVHQVTGRRYPFVTYDEHGYIEPVAPTLHTMLEWLRHIESVEVPTLEVVKPRSTRITHGVVNKKRSMTQPVTSRPSSPYTMITDWCAQQDPIALIGQYVELNQQRMGHCPFEEHHDHGEDRRRSFKVFHPTTPGGMSWYCYAWGKGGSVFDFLRLYYQLDARELWRRIQSGARF
ncbi:hypothetical protein KDW_46350 [Dictyobacter vulcani]|uniref:TOTE conflict system primase domain-containing protein n=1 Tax=Dictyobacter vulcani TaxID=2607529 RepID=A0A5J4KS30_9CHLR|nr:hypothetical protein [Dictyobacter vulcani]GER90473.1 hypothetical protein KDW_46350 [Dictyobacter vulcani]